MPEIVNISEHQSDISARPETPASATFDIVNVADRALDVALHVVAAPPGTDKVPDWITLSGEDQFRLDVAETRKCEIVISPPDDVDAGQIAFCLKAFEPALPEENTGLSNTVTAEIEEAEIEETPGTRWGLIAAVVVGIALLIGGGVGAWLLIGGGSTMPDLSGKTLAEARRILADDGDFGQIREKLVAVSSRHPKAGFVEDQSPRPGDKIERGGSVVLRVTANTMPNVMNQTETVARRRLANANIPASQIDVTHPNVRGGRQVVTNQNPNANQFLAANGRVSLTIPREWVFRPEIILLPENLQNLQLPRP